MLNPVKTLLNGALGRILRPAVPLFSIVAGFLSPSMFCGTLVPTYGTYFGGTGDANVAVAVAIDASGNVIVVGFTTSQTLPGTANAFQPMKAAGFPDNRDVFVAKFDPTGTILLWATFLGGDNNDTPSALAVDQTGSIYVVGTSDSSNLPVTSGAYITNSTGSGGFAAKISADGHSLPYLTYLPGGSGPTALAVNDAGESYIAGSFLPVAITSGALGTGADPVEAEDQGVYLLRLNSTGSSLVFGAYLGGGGFSGSKTTSVAIDQVGNAYVAGSTTDNAENVLTTSDAFQAQLPMGISFGNPVPAGFIAEVDPTGSHLLYGTYFGPPYSYTQITGLALAPDGSLYFSGSINTTALWATTGAYLSTPSPGFLAKLTPGKTALDSFSFLENSGTIFQAGIGNQFQQLYVGLGTTGSLDQIIGLNVPTLSLAVSYSLPQGTPAAGLGVFAAANAPPDSLWVVGLCGPCSLGNLISSNAFQPLPQTSNAAFLVQLTDISPTISFTGSAATGASPFAAGQLISIYGSQLGPAAGSGLQLGPGGVVTTSNTGTQVLFDGTPAPILYTGADQVNAAIPCAVAGHSSTQLVVDYMGAQSAPLTVPLGAAAPGIFTADGSGRGQAAALNQDNSFNSPSNPAPPGSVVTFYATGVGPTSPCVDGATYQSNFPTLTLPAIVGVGSSGAQVLYSGQAPDLVSGVAQFNVVIPSDANNGVVPLTLVVGGVFSTPGVTIAVK
jgi:uncharacterized protein (TIGR03437 family)